jgi:hypothetical protein
MAARRKKIAVEDAPDRPLCGCGKHPATHQVELTVRRLELDRDKGVSSRPYWTPSYRTVVTSIASVVCDECLAGKINVAVVVDATMAQAKKGPPS